MARIRSVDFLPEIFQTDANKQFLAATLDQLIQEPQFKKTQGYIGRTVGPGVNPNDKYVIEPSEVRNEYQLEPGIISLNPNKTTEIKNAITYPGLADALTFQGADGTRPDRLYSSEYYTWDPFVDFDTLVNFSQYFWIPEGPAVVEVANAGIPLTENFVVTKANGAYTISGSTLKNPKIQLVRGGNYTFQIDQDSQFWIQTNPGIAGVNPAHPNITARQVLGVTNNGTDNGTIAFNVPLKTAQEFFYSMTDIGGVDLVTSLAFDQINGAELNAFIAQYDGIDGIINLDTRTLIFDRDDVDQSIWQISYVVVGGLTYLQLNNILPVARLNRFTIQFGTQWSNTFWYKDDTGFFIEMPLLTAVLDTLYYQDSVNPDIFGRIDLIEQSNTSPININDIVGKPNYTSPNGVVFTNGLKVKFQSNVFPASYGSGSFAIECYGTVSGLNLITTDSTADLVPGQQIVFPGDVFGGIVTDTTYYVRTVFTNSQFSISTVEDGPALPLTTAAGTMPAIATQLNEYYVAGVGTAIQLLPVTNFIVPETYATDFNDNTALIDPAEADYLTINRDSPDLNAWSRSNRWFHIDVLNATGQYNDTPVILDSYTRAKRPILQFRGGIRLFNMGTDGKQPVDTIDFSETDALSNIEGATSYSVNNYTFVDGSRVIFAADTDPTVRNKIYIVNFVSPDSGEDGSTIAQPIINLVPAGDGQVLVDQSTVVIAGTQLGQTYWYDGTDWIEAQEKTAVQQAPLFDIFDSNNISLGNQTVYPSSTFVGTKLFSYAIGSGNADPVLGFQLKYLTLSNVGDIVFDNNLYADTFVFVRDNVSSTQNISTGFVYEYVDRTVHERLLGWQTAVTPSLIRQQFKFTYSGLPLKLDIAVLPSTETVVPPVQVFVGSVFKDPGTYTVTIDSTYNTTTIAFTDEPAVDEIVEVLVLSDQTSSQAFYQVPINLQQNPFNGNSTYFTLGTVRTHYESICQNLTTLVGKINGSNNTRDLGNIVPYGLIILQQSSPLTLSGYFLRSDQYNIFGALEYNSREYQKYKNQLLEAVTRQMIEFENTSVVLDTVIAEITLGRIEENPFYWSDMLPAGSVFDTTTYTISYTTTDIFDTLYVHNYTSANYLGLNVYLNGRILTRDLEYFVSTTGPTFTIAPALYSTLVNGDIITAQEYTATYGTFCPNTPTKLGLYPAWRPEIVPVKTSAGATLVILGHDGSQTPLFNDIRDDVLLEFETRIYNNLKLDDNPVPLTIADVLPGQFRNTGYSFDEINNILATGLLTYVGWNKLDYTQQEYNASNPFTFNYSQTKNKLDNQNLLGAWRGIYRYFYDTQQPELTPWEMIGFTVKPVWWELTYGPAPYTGDNLVLWEDMSQGLVRDPVAPYILPKYVRSGLTEVIPTDSEGALLSPLLSVAGTIADNTFQASWAVGDGGPVEASWWNSSDYPFAVMRLLALTRPAEFFALFADRDLYKYNAEFGQFLLNDRYRLDANGVQVYGDGVSKASYIDWIVDYNRVLGRDSTQDLQDDLANLDVRLCYRMASFSDKQYIKLYTEKSSPNSVNTSLLIPDDSYDLLVYKNQPFDRSIYSSVVIQIVADGWAVYGYSTTRPYFNTLTGIPTGQFRTFTVGTERIQVPANYNQTITQVPYGYVFNSESAVANFLLSYGKLLEQQGFEFADRANGYALDWSQMVQEYLYWVQQGWGEGTLLNLNPLAGKLSVTKAQAVVDTITAQTSEHLVLDQNRKDFPIRDLNIVRLDNTFTIEPLNNQSISFIDMRYTNFESMIVLNNVSLFGDLIYQPITGARQSRLNLVAVTSTEWNGSVDAQGFILNQNNIEEWSGLKIYPKGELVTYKGAYWSAATIVQPSTSFNYNDWNQSDYTLIQQGLLPNLANKADQLANSYNINSANLEGDNDLLSYGLIGFRPRQYFTALNLDDVSQLNVYRQFIGSKGTILSADLIGQAQLGKEAAEYTIYENWAVQRSVYGANANRSFFDLRLNRGLLTSDPALVQVVEPNQSSQADQAILLNDVWNSSFKLTTPNILPTTTISPTDSALPTAGYVNLDDADITVFSLDDPASLSTNLNSIKSGTKIWVAKVNDYDWNIYRAQLVPGQIQHICDNLNGTCRVIFSDQHGLSTGDRLIIRFFDAAVDGVYRVQSVSNLTTVNIALSLEGGRTVIDGTGIGFTLATMRVSQSSDIIDLSYALQIQPGAQVWVDDNGSGLWEVLEKENPFDDRTILQPKIETANEFFGSSVTQAVDRLLILVGSPGYNSAVGGVYVYARDESNIYTPVSPLGTLDDVLTLATTGLFGYGNDVDFGNRTWAVAGASASLGPSSQPDNGYAVVLNNNLSVVNQQQLLVQPGTTNTTTPGAGEFGYSVAMSLDERWMYVSAPGLNEVHAYGRVDWNSQIIKYISDGIVDTVELTDTIQIDNQTQLTVQAGSVLFQYGVDYTINGSFSELTFINVPAEDATVVIQRVTSLSLIGGSASYSLAALFTADNIYSFSVKINGILQRPFIDYIYSAGNLVFYATPGAGTVVVVTAGGYFQYVDTLTVASLSAGDRFGHSIQCGTDGRQVIIGCRNNTINGNTEAGAVYVFDRNVQKFIINGNSVTNTGSVTIGNVYSITALGTTDFTDLGATTNTVGTYFVATADGTVAATGMVEGTSYTITSLGTTDFTDYGAATNTVGTVFVATGAGTGTGQVCLGSGQVINNSVTVLNTFTAPITVIANNMFLVNQPTTTLTATNVFTIDDSDSVTLYTPLAVGDVVEIETNQFELQQQITQNTVAGFVNFGQSVDFCPNNCSIYTGAPQDSTVAFKGGVVQRNVNQPSIFGTITAGVANPSLTVGDTLRVNNVDCAVPAAVAGITSLQGLANNITANAPNATATVSANGYLTITVTNSAAAGPTDQLQVAPGTVIGTTGAFDDLEFETYVYTQTIESPYPVDFGAFGYSVAVDDTAINLVVGAQNGTLYLPNTFDYDAVLKTATTTFDGNGTTFFSPVIESGTVYTYDYFPSVNESLANPGKFVFGQQIGINSVEAKSHYGTSISYNSGILIVGAPRNDPTVDASDITAGLAYTITKIGTTDFTAIGATTNSIGTVFIATGAGTGTGTATQNEFNLGAVFVFENQTRVPAWTVKYIQQPTVDVRLLNSVYMYDQVTSAKSEFFDFFNPLQGKILGAAQQNLDYIGAVDPAQYNVGVVNNIGQTWGAEHVGEMWWDISTVRFIDPNQDSIVYASRRWGQVFPGSRVDVYQWVQSSTPPANYTGTGTPLNTLSYVVNTRLNREGTFLTEYYFWVRNVVETYTQQGKSLSSVVVASYIANPKASGIAYIAPINASTIAIYNGLEYVEAFDTIISIEFDQIYNDANIHTEYELIPQGRADGFLSNNLYRKLQDSFCGVDTFGNLVPDPNLSPSQRYGVQFRPRQSMFVNRFAALKNYIVRSNSVFALYPFSENANFALLNSADPEPSANSGEWNLKVANIEILSYQNINAVPVGYAYLVESDSTNNGLWTIYTVVFNGVTRSLLLTRVQNYRTNDYWTYIDWYLPGYNSSTKVLYEVPNYAALATLTVPPGGSVRVTANAQGKWEIYLKNATGWDRVGLQNGTIELSVELYDYQIGRFGFDAEVFDAQYFDQEPVIETRKIIQAINEELFIGELAIERNKLLTLMFNFILSELQAPEWLVKTSLIDVDHSIRQLIPYQNYTRDNQDFVIDYIQEVKPYHVQVRAFNLLYNGADEYFGDATDFDVPAYYDTALNVPAYVSPILTPYARSTAQAFNINSDTPPTSPVWTTWPYSQWYGNYLLTLDSVSVTHAGTGYTDVPIVTVVGDAETPAEIAASINSLGQVTAITVISEGSGYRETPTIQFDGGNGTGAAAYPVMANGLVRSFKTVIKYDRYQYSTTIVDWSNTASYPAGTRVRYNDQVWSADVDNGPAAEFSLADWTVVNPGTLSGADRTMGLYVPGVNETGLELPLLIDGIGYPGVQVLGKEFLEIEPLDAIYASSFTDQYLGLRPSDINIEGGEFIGPYEGHAPEELVNGAEYDTMDFRVYSRPGGNWTDTGHGFAFRSIRYTYLDPETNPNAYSWADVLPYPAQVLVSNVTSGLDLTPGVDFSIDWINKTISVITSVAIGDVININVYQVGGGTQLYREYFTGNTVQNTISVPVTATEISEIAFFVNGQSYPGASWVPYYALATIWSSFNSYQPKDVVTGDGFYHRALQYVPPGIALDNVDYWTVFVPTKDSLVSFPVTVDDTNGVCLVVLGDPDVPTVIEPYDSTDFDTGLVTNEAGSFDYSNNVIATEYSWSTPQVQYIVANASIVSTQTLTLTNSVEGTNPANLILTRNGLRLTPPAGIEWTGDDSTVGFGLPQRLGASFSEDSIDAGPDIQVWLDNVLQEYNVDYTVTPYTGTNTRQVVFDSAPGLGSTVLISVSTLADYVVGIPDGSTILPTNSITLRFIPNVGDTFAVTTWNDTSQQDIATLVFIGPITEGVTVSEPFDSTGYSFGSVNDAPGSFDYTIGVPIQINSFFLNRPDLTANRVWVTLSGERLQEGADFIIQNDYLILSTGTIGPTQILVVTEFAENTVPDAMAFRIFQDMRGIQATYRMTVPTTTYLTQTLTATADVIHVADASALVQPDLNAGIFGVITIDGERIMYRERDTVANTVSGLQRGTAGTGADSHLVDALVYDFGRSNIMPVEFQNYVVSDTSVGDGSSVATVFTAPDISDTNYINPISNAGNFEIGNQYAILTVGTTNFVTVGASANTIGVIFTATGAGTGTGTAYSLSAFDQSIEVYVGGTRSQPGCEVVDAFVGKTYIIASPGDTDWYAIGLPSTQYPTVGTVITITENSVDAGDFIVGNQYTILTVGSTNFVAVGASSNTVGVVFTATGAGTGTGTASGYVNDGVLGNALANNYYTITATDPVEVTFITASDLPIPGDLVEVTILQRRGVTWYAPGVNTPSNGVPLQVTDTLAARFLRGL